MKRSAGVVVAGLAAVAVAGFGIASAMVARRVIGAGRVHYSDVLPTSSPMTVRLERNAATALPGRYGLEFDDGSRVIVGPVIGRETTDGSVMRAVVNGQVPAGATRARFTGAAVTPADLGVDEARVPRARSGAWRFDGDGSEARDGTWVVHTHGLGASPLATLRSVQAVQRAGLPSLVTCLGSAFAERRSGADATDVDRVIAAIDDAVTLGARRVIVCGWSYGAALSLAAARERPEVVQGAILISPMLGLSETVLHAAAVAGVPRVLVHSALAVLSTPVLARSAGVRGAVPVRALSAGPIDGLPTLAIHSPGDTTIPVELTRAIAHRSPSFELVEVAAAPHGLEWNVAPEAFETAVREWLGAR
ncbi:Serine aminopeptidase, S33 [Plantibacter sp. VKM Ac-1784]|uniref:Serine aminopeptidase, S33 n=1 Tax=Plantibacter elymi (nom. nud.) TaxID=199708 RepID=A0ABY1RBB8_9MICO|nr:alpha/beta hydrolase [Plantibacter sp. VKM Ac-1784]SMQ62475.1 Serine aminopeptidase, S33 [Plantibacter sp. VKM Ac-1784]